MRDMAEPWAYGHGARRRSRGVLGGRREAAVTDFDRGRLRRGGVEKEFACANDRGLETLVVRHSARLPSSSV